MIDPAVIKAVRRRAGITQTEAARIAGYAHQQAWAAIECGSRAMTPERWAYFKHRAGIERMPFTPRR